MRLIVGLCFLTLLAGAQRAPPQSNATSWKTLSGGEPLVIANGGQSGLFPDQTFAAYQDALQKCPGGIALYCDLQLSKDSKGICRTNIDLQVSTSIGDVGSPFQSENKTYSVNGKPTSAYFSIDFTGDQLLNNITAKQVNVMRSPNFDMVQGLFSPELLAQLLASYANSTGLPAYLWLNVEYARFYEQHKINVTSYLISAIRNLSPAYISSTEVALLRALRSRVSRTRTKTIFRVPDVAAVEPTSNRTYGSLLGNLTNIKTFASGILVSKDLIWTPNGNYLGPSTSLVPDAHRQKLEVHAFTFQNDAYPSSFNYSYDPVKEVLQFIDGPEFAVDGILTDFPTTGSTAIKCFAREETSSSSEIVDKAVLAPFTGKQVLTHSGGDSGNFPGSTRLAYTSALEKGADYIDCPVQMTKDGVPICRQNPDLFLSTNVAATPFNSRTKTVKSLQDAAGVFTFDLTWDEISTLKAKIVSPQREQSVLRNTDNDDKEGILKLSDFLSIAKANPKVGVYLVLQKAYLLNGTFGIDTVAAVASALRDAKLDNSTSVVIQSEDAAVLRSLSKLVSAELIYSIPGQVTLTDDVLGEIKTFAGGIAVTKGLISPSSGSFLTHETSVVELAHNHSLSVLVVFFRNEFVSIPFDFLADPTLELNTYVQLYKVDGLVTDFPETAKAYLSNKCLRDPNGFQILTIEPGLILPPPPAGAPFPPLSIAEPPLAPVAPAPAPTTKSSSFNSVPDVWFTSVLVLVISSWQRHFF